MKKIIIFSGTTEGRRLSEALTGAGVKHEVCVATEYGRLVMEPGGCAHINEGRMDPDEMRSFIGGRGPMVFDATHPYAAAASENIRTACEECGAEYYRILRAGADTGAGNVIRVNDHSEAALALKNRDGNILLTVGSLNAGIYSGVPELRERLFVRVLPSAESIITLNRAGINAGNIIAMQGPHSVEMNLALIRRYDIRWLVTKESGAAGGYGEKILAAEKAGAGVISVGRPEAESGITFGEALKILGLKPRMKITLAGIGPGAGGLMSGECRRAISESEVVFGAERMTDGIPAARKYPFYLAKDVIPVLESLQPERAAVLFSGDTGFFSGAVNMYCALREWADESGALAEIVVIPGISSVSALAAAVGEPYSGYPLMSLHGKRGDQREFDRAADAVARSGKVFLILSGAEDLRTLGEVLERRGLSECEIRAGYRLSYPDEEIMTLTPGELKGIRREGLYTACIINPKPEEPGLLPFLPDGDFIRGKTPMTKEMIRHAAVIRLGLEPDSVLYDVGSGTGSVSVEAAGVHPGIRVFAIEKDSGAIELTKKNAERFKRYNITVTEGEAPEAFMDLPAPSRVFIGGSGGRLREIIEAVRERNDKVRMVITAISLETISQAHEAAKSLPPQCVQVEQIAVSRGRRAGSHTLMSAENPVYIFTLDFGGGQ